MVGATGGSSLMGTVRCAAGRIASVAFSVALPTSCVASSSDERLLPALVVAGNASVAVPSLSVGEDDESIAAVA